MASTPFNNPSNELYANSGITGVEATKSGNVVQLYFYMNTVSTATQGGYVSLGFLSAKFRPAHNIATLIYDNSVSTRDKSPIFITINASTGAVSWYATGAGDKCAPRGVVTYIAASPTV